MGTDATNLQPPDFGPTYPLYPQIDQLVKVTGPSVGGIYPGVVQQYATPFIVRSREPCYVVEPNGVPLGSAVYDCRLVNSHLGKPLYATTCCVSTSSSSSASPAPAPVVTRTSLGFISGGYPVGLTSLTLPNVTVPSGGLLIAVVSILGSGAGIGSVKFGPYTLSVDATQNLLPASALQGMVAILSALIDVGRTDSIVFTPTVAARLTIQAVQVTGIDGVPDRTAGAAGIVFSPDTGQTLATTASPGYAQGAFALLVPPAFAWQNGFASGGQDLSGTLGGTATTVTEGWMNLPNLQTADAALSGVPASWAGVLSTYY